MSDAKTYVFGQDANNSILSCLMPMLSQRGIDPNVLLAMQNNGFGGNNGGWFFWVILLLLFGWNRNGFGNGAGAGAALAGDAYLGNLINNTNGRDLLMQAIQNNSNATTQLAQMFNCSVQSMQNAICQIQNAITGVGNQVGMSGMQTINAIQAGNNTIASQIAQCCCDQRLATCEQTNTLQQAINGVAVGQERGFSQIGFETQRQTCEVRDAIRENTAQVLAGQRAAEMREMQRELAERDRKIAEQASELQLNRQTGIFSQMINQAIAPVNIAIANLQGDINNMKCKMPETATVPYSPIVGIPTCVAAQYGLGYGFPYSQWG